MQNSTKKVLIVDDEQRILEMLRAYFESDGYLVFEAQNGKQALELFDSIAPSLIILDLMLPDKSGEDVCKAIRRKSRVPIIMLTAKADEENMLQGLNIGADDYIIKPFSPREILARASAVLRRVSEDQLTGEAVTFDNDHLLIDYKNYIVKIDGCLIDLTPTEFKILATLSKSPSKTFTRSDLIIYALDDNFDGYDRTMDTYIKNLRKKIEPDIKRPRYILTIHGVGYKFGGE